VVRQVLDQLQSGLPFCAAGSTHQPMTLHQMDLLRGYPDADNPTTASWCPATVALYRQDLEYMPDLAFVGIRPARTAYGAAAQDFCTNWVTCACSAAG
jgi:hypothetical protein